MRNRRTPLRLIVEGARFSARGGPDRSAGPLLSAIVMRSSSDR